MIFNHFGVSEHASRKRLAPLCDFCTEYDCPDVAVVVGRSPTDVSVHFVKIVDIVASSLIVNIVQVDSWVLMTKVRRSTRVSEMGG